MILEIHFVTFIRIFLSLSSDLSIKGDSFLCRSLSRDIFIYGTSFLFWSVCTESKSILFFRYILSTFIAVERSFGGRELAYGKQDGSHCVKINPQFLRKSFRKKVSLFLQIHMKKALSVKTTALPITTTRRVFYPLVNIILYYLETFKSY